jgi:predicted esterase
MGVFRFSGSPCGPVLCLSHPWSPSRLTCQRRRRGLDAVAAAAPMAQCNIQGEGTMRLRHLSIWTVSAVILVTAVSARAAEPTHKDVRYAKKFERSVLDIWTVKSDKAAPLVVYFHGGGFKAGDKKHFYGSQFLKKYHPKGVAFATVNYPFLKHTNNSYAAILQHTVEAIKFLGKNAKKYNIDNKRISVMGSSAGALISGYLGHGSKLPIRSVFAHQQPMGTPALIVPILHRGGPPIVVYNTSAPSDRVHHPDNAVAVLKRCKQVKVPCQVYGSAKSGLPEVPEGQEIHDIVMKVFYKTWKLPNPYEKDPKAAKEK